MKWFYKYDKREKEVVPMIEVESDSEKKVLTANNHALGWVCYENCRNIYVHQGCIFTAKRMGNLVSRLRSSLAEGQHGK